MNLTKIWLTEKSTIVTDTRLKWRKAWCPPGWSRATYLSKSCHPTSWPKLRWSTWPGDHGTHVQASTTMSLRLGLHNFVTNTLNVPFWSTILLQGKFKVAIGFSWNYLKIDLRNIFQAFPFMYEFKGTYADFVRLFREEGGMYGSYWNHLEVNIHHNYSRVL